MTIVSVEKDFESLSLTLITEFDAPVERVWELWSDPRQLERWWGPPSHPATVETHELAPGGEVTYYMTGPDGEKSRGWWRVKSADAPFSLGFTDGFANPDGSPNADMPTTSARVELSEHNGRTRMQLRFVFQSREHMNQLERWGAFDVFPESVGQMDAILVAGRTHPQASRAPDAKEAL